MRLSNEVRGEGGEAVNVVCPTKNCAAVNEPTVAKDGFYKGLKFCFCYEFKKGPYAEALPDPPQASKEK